LATLVQEEGGRSRSKARASSPRPLFSRDLSPSGSGLSSVPASTQEEGGRRRSGERRASPGSHSGSGLPSVLASTQKEGGRSRSGERGASPGSPSGSGLSSVLASTQKEGGRSRSKARASSPRPLLSRDLSPSLDPLLPAETLPISHRPLLGDPAAGPSSKPSESPIRHHTLPLIRPVRRRENSSAAASKLLRSLDKPPQKIVQIYYSSIVNEYLIGERALYAGVKGTDLFVCSRNLERYRLPSLRVLEPAKPGFAIWGFDFSKVCFFATILSPVALCFFS
jgi:hypothetical protein